MQIKFILTADGVEHELGPDCVTNWDDIKCTWKRKDFSGIVRSFTSKFEFVNAAYDILLNQFQRFETEAQVTIGMLAMNNQWGWDKVFECPLDFSTYHESNGVIKVSAIDNSAEALIKANKSTKYEYVIGEDIVPERNMMFGRIPMQEMVTYAITIGDTQDDGSLIVNYHLSTDSDLVFLGTVGSEIPVGGVAYFPDDLKLGDNIITAYKNVTITMKSKVVYDAFTAHTNNSMLSILYPTSSGGQDRISLFGGDRWNHNYGWFATEEEFRANVPFSSFVGMHGYTIINGNVYRVSCNSSYNDFVLTDTGHNYDYYTHCVYERTKTFTLKAGESLVLEASSGTIFTDVHIYSSSFSFSWMSQPDPISVPVFTPMGVLQALMSKIFGERPIYPYISNMDWRMARTKLMAAEGVRDMENAKLYSSFNDFVDWMETVFGYTYYIKFFEFASVIDVWSYTSSSLLVENEKYTGTFEASNITYMTSRGKFICFVDGVGYADFNGSETYNDPSTGKARRDVLFHSLYRQEYFYLNEGNVPIPVSADDVEIASPLPTLCFVHRSEIFRNSVPKLLDTINDVSYDVDSSIIYSSLEIGYDKKDYNSINGREEFNFSNEYSTGSTVSEKKKALKSKYRADGYGLEFTAQKRGKETTDAESDQDIFFVLAPDDPLAERNPISLAGGYAYNGMYSPMACIRANAGFLAAQAKELTLTFASSKGNSDVVLGDEPMTANHVLNNRLFTAGRLSFITDDIDVPDDLNGLVQVEDNGITYIGYISELEIRLGKQQAAKYKLIVKSRTIEQ